MFEAKLVLVPRIKLGNGVEVRSNGFHKLIGWKDTQLAAGCHLTTTFIHLNARRQRPTLATKFETAA